MSKKRNNMTENCQICSNKCALCQQTEDEIQLKCPCGICIVKVMCRSKCNDWLIFWIRIKEITKNKRRNI